MRKLILLTSAALLITGCGDKSGQSSDTLISETKANRPAVNPNKNAYFGDLHIHTRNSFDAYIFNVRATPDDLYDFAKGKPVMHPSGFEMTLDGPPLDFVAATDHGSYMGILPAMDNPDSPLSKTDIAKDIFGAGLSQSEITSAFNKIGASVRSGIPYKDIYDRPLMDSTWQKTMDAADRHYEPGTLTTFSAYEYTAVTLDSREEDSFGGGNLHRNVVFRGDGPDRLFSTLDSVNPEDLWDWMDETRASGMDSMAIPHNSNVSDGEMFKLGMYDNSPLSKVYADQRIRNEPIVELSQVKGTSETHPSLSPNDEWANFEIYEDLLATQIKSKVNGSYIREALSNGFKIESETGTNPFKFGFIGSSDSHVIGGAYTEENYWSKVGILDGTAAGRGSIPPGGAKRWEGVQRNPNAEHWFTRWGASGLAVVWAEENTREAIFDGMRAKESYATSGPRIQLRMFASHDYDENLVNDAELVSKAYAGGVPMGGELSASETSPGFIVWAQRDPRNAPLQRLQMVKAWHANGKAQEAVYDIACSDGAMPDANHRCADNGASVDLTDCSISKDSGDPELRTFWRDPDFKAGESAAYYVRVLENPTCRWSTWDALKAGVERHPDLPPTLQERAWSSPIWYNAKG